MSPGRGSGDAGSGLRLGLAPEGLGRQPEKRGCAPRAGRSARETALGRIAPNPKEKLRPGEGERMAQVPMRAPRRC